MSTNSIYITYITPKNLKEYVKNTKHNYKNINIEIYEEFISALDEAAIIAKTDAKGIILSANDNFFPFQVIAKKN
jgi:diphthamide synthase subunit DPH2